MGSPKQLLPWGDTTLLNHAIAQAQKTGVPEVFMVLGAHADKIGKSIESPTAEILIHEEWDAGLGSSIAYGIQHITKNTTQLDAVLIMLADQPEVDTEYLNSMIKRFKPGKKQIIASNYSDQLGVPAIFDASYFEKLAQLSGDTGAQQTIKEHAAFVTACSSAKDIVDIDTMKTYKVLFKEHFGNQ